MVTKSKKVAITLGILSLFANLFRPTSSFAAIACPVDQNQFIGVTSPVTSEDFIMADDIRNVQRENGRWEDFAFDYSVRIPYPSCGGDPVRRVCEPPGAGGTPVHADTVDFTVGINSSNTLFTQIYTNFLGMLPYFVNESDAKADISLTGNEASQNRWDRYYCLSGLDDSLTENNAFTSGANGTAIYQVEVKVGSRRQLRPDELPAWEDCDPNRPENQNRNLSPRCSCYLSSGVYDPNPLDSVCFVGGVTWEKQERTASFSETNTEAVAIPYADGLRELAKKTSSLIKEQYCVVGEEKTCLEGYNCLSFEALGDLAPANYEKDPAANGKTGACVRLKEGEDGNLVAIEPNLAQSMCTDVTSGNLTISRLSSNVCYYTDDSLALTQCPEGGCANFEEYPYLQRADIAPPTNSLPFDTDLFADNGELTNINCTNPDPADPDASKKCVLDGYFKRVFQNKLSNYSPIEQNWYEDLPGYIDIAGQIRDSSVSKINGARAGYYKDMIENLGKYTEISNDARFLNPNLLPTGFRVISSGNNTAYLRAVNNVSNGILFVNGHPLGKLPTTDLSAQGQPLVLENAQNPPAIYTNPFTRQFVVSTVVGNQMYMMLSGQLGALTPLQRVTSINNAQDDARQFSFVTSQGDAIFATKTPARGDGFVYSIYNATTKSFSNAQNIDPLFAQHGAIALDFENNIHVVGAPQDELTNTLYYGKYRISSDKRSLEAIVSAKPITLPANISSYPEQSHQFSINSDGQGGALIVVNTAISNRPANDNPDWWDNNIYFIRMDQNGNIDGSQTTIAVNRSSDVIESSMMNVPNTRPTVHHKLQGNGANVIRRFNTTLRQFETYIIYTKSVYLQSTNGGPVERKISQVNLARKIGDFGRWEQGIELSENIDDRIGKVGWGSIDLSGKISFTLLDSLTRYDASTKSFDAAGYKQCIYDEIPRLSTRNCGMISPTTGYVIPPTQSARNTVNPDIMSCEKLINPNYRQETLDLTQQMSCGRLPRYY